MLVFSLIFEQNVENFSATVSHMEVLLKYGTRGRNGSLT